jgi:predicted dehydrogenase
MAPQSVWQIDFDMFRFDRRDADFSTTAIHAIDSLLHLARSPLREVSFRYRDMTLEDSVVTNIVMEGMCESGTEVRLNILPVAGLVLERASIHARGQSLLLEIALRGDRQEGSLHYWRRDKLEVELTVGGGDQSSEAAFEQNGFHAENEAFFDAVRRQEQMEGRVQDCGPQILLTEAIRNRAASVVLEGSGRGRAAPAI